MSTTLRLDRSIPVLTFDGRLDARGAAAFDEAWQEVPPEASHAVLDLTGVGYLSSIGIRSLVTAEKALRERRGGIILVGLSALVARILDTTGLLREFKQLPSVSAAVEHAVLARAANSDSTQHVVNGRLYKISPASVEPCLLELWGDYDQTFASLSSVFSILESPPPSRPVAASLHELGFAFGEGGFGDIGSHSAECVGPFVAARKFAGVLPDGGAISDFVISERPEEVEVVISRAIGFAGPPSFQVEVTAAPGASLQTLLTESVALLPGGSASASPVLGFVVRTEGPQPALLAAVGSPGLEKLYGNMILYQTAATLAPRLEDLKGAAPIRPQSAFEAASIAVYIPDRLRLGVEKRLQIQADAAVPIRDEWDRMIRRLYSDCSRVMLSQLTGGYMATTFRVTSYDRDGRRLLPTVLKISTTELIQREEEAHRAYVQKFILNNSTTIMGVAWMAPWAALRYNFLGISGPEASLTWLRDYYVGRPTEDVLRMFHRLYTQILKPWYGQPRWEQIPLYADHSPLRLFPDVCARAERDFGFSPDQEEIECPELGIRFPNPFQFLQTEYAKRASTTQLWYQAINHGDLNLRNVLVDELENLYVIDFSETHPRNIVSDFARMEAILKFEMTRIDTVDDLARMVEFEQGLAEPASLAETPPNRYRGNDPLVDKAYAVICRLRHYADTVTLFETDLVPYWLALLEWTFSVMCYDLPPLRRKLAAYSAAILCARIRARQR